MGFVETGNRHMVMRTAAGRYLRLGIPIFFACMLSSALLNANLIPDPENRPFWNQQYFDFDPTLWHLIRFSLFDVYFNHSYEGSYAPPLWTMSYELFGSFGLAAMLLLVGKPSDNKLAYGLVTAVLFVLQPWYSLFLIGIVAVQLRQWLVEHVPGWAGLMSMIAGSAIAVILDQHIKVLVISSTLFFIGALHAPAACTFFSNRLSRWLGEISFPLYLTHVPITFAVGMPIYMIDFENNLLRFGAGCLAVAASILVAMMFSPINTWAMQASRWAGRTIIPGQKVTGLAS
ncbi:hypothetical protein EV662_1114 [Rhodovulum marinum]|uniref:Acyltransferase 3 domain-containing protein n=2 Tax=Rhodovulum marinum TaxID=320662 RepID=A0A4R2PW82_9RHOB|nr:hypothetical protein EV662_1114 [Rhodovulum marinum]